MKLSHILVAATLFTLPVLANANQPLCEASDVHCVSFAGASGKFLKVTASVGTQVDSFVECFDNMSSISVDAQAVESGFLHVGDVVKAEFRQCTDQNCLESMVINNESFTIDKLAQGGYSSTPRFNTVQLDDSYGKTCSPSFSKSSMTRVHVK